MQKIWWGQLTYGDWQLYIAATENGLCYIGTPHAPFEELENWAAKYLPKAQLIESDTYLQTYYAELKAYLEGERQGFHLPLDLYGTEFQRKIWAILQEIPYGETWSYTDVAEKLGNLKAVRAVGSAIGANPVLIVVPCHRVITKDGKLGGFRAGLSMKKQLLSLENRENK